MSTDSMSRRRAGVVIAALAVFVVALGLQDGLRDDLSATQHWVSHLSLGPWGWVNIVSLLLAGAAAGAIIRPVRAATSSRWPAVWVAVTATGLVLAAVFVSDAPPGTRYGDETTWHGQLHDLGGGLTFLGLFATCIVTRRLVSRAWGIAFAVIVALGFVTASAMAAASFAADGPALPSGIAERVALLAGLGWLAILAYRLSRGEDR